jgi:hypothetical protein
VPFGFITERIVLFDGESELALPAEGALLEEVAHG